MTVLAEALLRNTELDDRQRLVCLRGIAQVAAADGKVDPKERAYLRAFVEEFFEGRDPTDESLGEPLSAQELEVLDTPRVREAFVAFLYMAAHVDEDFSEDERRLIEELTEGLVTEKRRQEILTGVRELLYRRAVFGYASRFGRLDEPFAVKMAERFQVPRERAVELNAQVFNALMALKAPVAQGD